MTELMFLVDHQKSPFGRISYREKNALFDDTRSKEDFAIFFPGSLLDINLSKLFSYDGFKEMHFCIVQLLIYLNF